MTQVLIIGGGTAGIMTAAQLLKNKSFQVSIIEPSEVHYYQPAWTLVGANAYSFEKTKKSMSEVMPAGVNWIKDFAVEILAKENQVKCRSGKTYSYDFLVVAPGIKIDTTLVKGLTEAIDKGVVCSNYTNPKHTWEVLKNFKGGTALFTQPATPIKCGGAPQKIMYLADDYFKKTVSFEVILYLRYGSKVVQPNIRIILKLESDILATNKIIPAKNPSSYVVI